MIASLLASGDVWLVAIIGLAVYTIRSERRKRLERRGQR